MPISARQRLAAAAAARLLKPPPARNGYTVESVRTPMRDGVALAGDHFAPDSDKPRGTVLIRTPYGRDAGTAETHGALFAARGYHVLLQSVRGTYGSGGEFHPMVQEADDGRDTVGWLREQPWFDGRLATLGHSYLGWTQWTLLQNPPPELRAALVYVGPHDFRESTFGTGAFALGDYLSWSDEVSRQEEGGQLRKMWTIFSGRWRLKAAREGLPLATAAELSLGDRAPWYREWLEHPDGDDPWWDGYRAGSALERVDVPVLLVGGWQDVFLEQTLEQYAALTARKVPVGLTVGPWAHADVSGAGAAQVAAESLAWLDEHLADGEPARTSAVHVYRTGEDRWHHLASWPPASTPATFQLHADGSLTTSSAAPAAEGDVSFRYHPAHPTPSVGGRRLAGSIGVQDNRKLEARADVVTFTTDPLPTAVDVNGAPVVELALTVDTPHADVFLRICEVDERGRSANVTDVLHRLDPSVEAGTEQRLRIELDPCFHRLAAGHRLRLQISGGAFPRYSRNLGTPATTASGNTLRASLHVIHCGDSRLVLPIAPDASSTTR